MNKNLFLVAKRKIKSWSSAMSIAATWVWAPALFLSAQKAYQQGITGLGWFLIPNVLCLIIFGFFAYKVRTEKPHEYTLSSYIKGKSSSKKVQGIYIIELVGLAVCSYAIQLLAGAKLLDILTGVGYFNLTIILSAIVLGYSVLKGLKASIITDNIQYWLMLGALVVLVPWTIAKTGFGAVIQGFSGVTEYTQLSVLIAFGIPVTIGLLSGPFGDQSFWQRTFAMPKENIKKSFMRGAFLFMLIPLLMGTFGFIGAGLGMNVSDPSMINLNVVQNYLPIGALVIFAVMLLGGLTSTLDSNLCAVSCITGHDFSKDDKKSVFRGRMGMVILAILGIGVANIPGMKILYLFLFYGTLRASTLVPTIYTIISKKKVSESVIFRSMITSIAVCVPVFGYAKLYKNSTIAMLASVGTILIPIIYILIDKIKQKNTNK